MALLVFFNCEIEFIFPVQTFAVKPNANLEKNDDRRNFFNKTVFGYCFQEISGTIRSTKPNLKWLRPTNFMLCL
jgi:hypothetical protein